MEEKPIIKEFADGCFEVWKGDQYVTVGFVEFHYGHQYHFADDDPKRRWRFASIQQARDACEHALKVEKTYNEKLKIKHSVVKIHDYNE